MHTQDRRQQSRMLIADRPATGSRPARRSPTPGRPPPRRACPASCRPTHRPAGRSFWSLQIRLPQIRRRFTQNLVFDLQLLNPAQQATGTLPLIGILYYGHPTGGQLGVHHPALQRRLRHAQAPANLLPHGSRLHQRDRVNLELLRTLRHGHILSRPTSQPTIPDANQTPSRPTRHAGTSMRPPEPVGLSRCSAHGSGRRRRGWRWQVP